MGAKAHNPAVERQLSSKLNDNVGSVPACQRSRKQPFTVKYPGDS